MPNHTLFVSDVHLSENRPTLVKLFLDFLDKAASKADSLYILGDLFDVWVGDDYQTTLSRSIAKALTQLTHLGVNVYFMPGNRDFLIGDAYAKLAHWHVLSDPSVIHLYNTPTLLTHGDLLCTDDIAYQRYRRVVRHPFARRSYLALPLSLRKKIAQKLRDASKRHQKKSYETTSQVTLATVMHFIEKYHVTQLIHGHTHKIQNTQIPLKTGKIAKHLILGDWYKTGNFLICDPTKSTMLNYI